MAIRVPHLRQLLPLILGAASITTMHAADSTTRSLPAGLRIIPGAVNGVVIERGDKVACVYGDPSGKVEAADLLLLTHARRDAVWAAYGLARGGAAVAAPAREAELLTSPDRFWSTWGEKRFHDYAQQSTRLPVQSLPVSRIVKAGDTLSWEGLPIQVLETPGYTRGAVSYLLELNGKRVVFSGDLIRDDGKLQDLFSLQDAIPSAKIGGYHGWAARLGDVMSSLETLAGVQPDLVVPLRGPVIADPITAIRRLQGRIRSAYSNYLTIDALRWYFKDEHILEKAKRVLGPGSRPDWMPMAETFPLPPEIIPISNSRLLLAQDGSGFLVDCGGMGIINELRKLRAAGKLKSLDHVFVTHYHDDHTDALSALVAEFGARVHACGTLVDLIEHPERYRLPCLTKNPTAVTASHRHGDSWQWKEYELKIYDFPGQTLYHNALLVRKNGGWSAFFAGDSFTPSGIDDYCLQNRNFLHGGQGFFRCLDEVEKLPKDCMILNQHVEPAFRYTPSQLAFMRDTLRRRIPLLKDLLPFDDPNYGLDESWVRLHPYWVRVKRGEAADIECFVTNHSPRRRTYRGALQAPQAFRVSGPRELALSARSEGAFRFRLEVPADAPLGQHVLLLDIRSAQADLREWTEAVLEVNAN